MTQLVWKEGILLSQLSHLCSATKIGHLATSQMWSVAAQKSNPGSGWDGLMFCQLPPASVQPQVLIEKTWGVPGVGTRRVEGMSRAPLQTPSEGCSQLLGAFPIIVSVSLWAGVFKFLRDWRNPDHTESCDDGQVASKLLLTWWISSDFCSCLKHSVPSKLQHMYISYIKEPGKLKTSKHIEMILPCRE